MLKMLLDERPAVVSFHFGLPPAGHVAALHEAGIVLLATATNPKEARSITAAGIDAVIAQGYEAGGHRGLFDPNAPDDRLGTFALTRLLVRRLISRLSPPAASWTVPGSPPACCSGRARPTGDGLHRLPGVGCRCRLPVLLVGSRPLNIPS